jgi:predicted MFS family arabinose efflux permease
MSCWPGTVSACFEASSTEDGQAQDLTYQARQLDCAAVKLATRGFAPLRYRRFGLLVGGQLASNVGNAFFAIALPWYALRVHGGTVLLGTVLAGYGTARVATLVPGGSAADRWRPWTVMMVSDSTQAVLTGLLALVAVTNQATLWELLPVAVVIGAANGIFMPGAFAIVPSLLPDDALQAGNALLNGSNQLAGLVGPAIGGAVVALVGPAAAFGADGVSFVVSVITLAAIWARRPSTATQANPSSEATPPVATQGPKGPGAWQLLRRERLLQVLVLVILVANLGSGGLIGVAFPALAHGPFDIGADGYGDLLACCAAGGVIGVLAAAHLGPGRRPAMRAAWLSLAANALLALVPYLGGPVGAGVDLVIWAAVNTLGNLILFTLLQRWAPPGSLGRVMSLVLLASVGAYPVSVALAGLLVPELGPGPFFPVAAIFTTVAVLGALTQAQFRDLGRLGSPASSAM